MRTLGGVVTKLCCARRSGLRRRKTIDRLRVQTPARNARAPSAGAGAPSWSEPFQLPLLDPLYGGAEGDVHQRDDFVDGRAAGSVAVTNAGFGGDGTGLVGTN